jgi:hypothetical protein
MQNRKTRRLWITGILAGLMVLLIGCPSVVQPDNGGNDSDDTIPATGVTISTSQNLVVVDQTLQLSADVSPSDATNTSVTWSSDNDNIATVDADGHLTGVAEGTATITVTTEDGGFTDTQTIDVVAPIYNGTGTITLPDGTTQSLTGGGFGGSYDPDDDIYIYGIILFGGSITASADSVTGTGPLVWIDLDEFSGHADEPQSESYEFGGGSAVTETRGFFVEFGVIEETTVSDYSGGDGPFAGAGPTPYAYHIFDASPSYDNIDPTTLTAGFSDEGGQRGPSAGSTLDIAVSQDNGDAWDISFTFGTPAGN